MMLKLSIVIPTKDREEDIIKCVESISKQTSMPAEVLVIDDGQISETTKEKIRQMLLEKDIVFKYFKKDNPGLAESKNLGAKESNGDVVLFLDDDVILDKDYIKNLLIIWSKKWNEKKLAGVSGVISNSRIKSSAEILFNKIFFLYSAKPWSILPWGFQTWDFHLKKDEFSDWVPGGTSSFRKEIFNIYQFKAL
ncbi:MAG: glycosyltransferase family A protein, partial [Candidatus Staskawiczbacteria bacterium]